MDWAKTTARREEKKLSLGFDAPYTKGLAAISTIQWGLNKTTDILQQFSNLFSQSKSSLIFIECVDEGSIIDNKMLWFKWRPGTEHVNAAFHME